MDKLVCKILAVLFAVSSAPHFSYAGKRIPRKLPKTNYRTVGPGLPTQIIPPSVMSETIAKNSKAAPVKGLSFSQMEEALRKSMRTPPVLALSFEMRNGQPVSILPEEELRTYLNYAVPLAPVLTVYQKVQTLQATVGNEENFFLDLVNTYYSVHFSLFTPHVLALHEKIASLRSTETENKYLKRLEQLAARKEQVAQVFNKSIDSSQLRVRYLQDVDELTAKNFNPDALVLTVEQRMSPSLKRGLFRHLTGETKIRIKHQPYAVYRFKGPPDHLYELYTFLVNGNYLSSRMSLVIDHPRRSLFLYNFDGSVWLRVTPHEYVSQKRLHVHVNKILPFDFMEEDKLVQDRVLLNLSVPIEAPKRISGEEEPAETLEYLFFTQPAEQLKELPHVTVTEKR